MTNKTTQILHRICFMITIPLVSIIHIILNTYRHNIHILGTKLDNMIPFKESFAIPYLYWFLYIFIILVYFAVVDYRYYFRLLMSIIAGMFICFIIYYFYPTMVPRPEITGDGFLNWLVRDFIYKRDNPFNCFPSIHVLNSLLVTLFFCRYNRNFALKALSVLSCVAICLSTLFIKQHYIADVLASILLGTIMYGLFAHDAFWNSVPVRRVIGLVATERFKDYYAD